jgi:hypothetical protein
MANRSRAALLEFLDYLASKGLMNQETAAARKAAANRVLGVLDAAEAEDVSVLDIDDLMTRFHNLEGSKFTPQSLNTYKSRLKSAIDDFLRYQKDPLNFRPNVQSSGRRSDRSKISAEPPPTPPQAQTGSTARSVQEPPPAAVNILPIPIRPDLTIKVQGLPYDLTTSEAAKIANVVKAMAVSD